jgi:hypothetical protein
VKDIEEWEADTGRDERLAREEAGMEQRRERGLIHGQDAGGRERLITCHECRMGRCARAL